MAKIFYTGIITEIVGSILGSTFQKNTSGNIIRAKPRTVKRLFPKQLAKQNTPGKFIQQWNFLTLAEQLQWDVFAFAHSKTNIWNQQKTLTGFNWYFSINANRELVNQTELTTPPAYNLPIAVPNYSSYWDNSTMKLFLNSYTPDLDVQFMTLASQPIKATQTGNRRFYRLISQFNADGITILDIKNDWQNYFGIDLNLTTFDNCNILFGIFSLRISTGLIQPVILQVSRFGEGGSTMSKIYKTLLTQNGITAPTAIILENTIGNIVWSRTAAGEYSGTLASAFPTDLTFQISGISDQLTQIAFYRPNVNTVRLNTLNIQTLLLEDDLMNNVSIHIQTY